MDVNTSWVACIQKIALKSTTDPDIVYLIRCAFIPTDLLADPILENRCDYVTKTRLSDHMLEHNVTFTPIYNR